MSFKRGKPSATALCKVFNQCVDLSVEFATANGIVNQAIVKKKAGKSSQEVGASTKKIDDQVNTKTNGSGGKSVTITIPYKDKHLNIIQTSPQLPNIKLPKESNVALENHVNPKYANMGHALLNARLNVIMMKEFPGFTAHEMETLIRKYLENPPLELLSNQYKTNALAELVKKTGTPSRAAEAFRAYVGRLSVTNPEEANLYVDQLFIPILKNFRVLLITEGKNDLHPREFKRLTSK